ncbi:MAG: ATP-binding protein [Parcubacteria group bacterium GW2011_GWA2_42_11]|nr:MAG: ATP-binding protein [Parcubacteria group bacterium GW2011_GWA2_42_11]
MEFITKTAEETQQLAGKILEEATKKPHRGALVLALRGELGAGKTTFTQGLGAALGLKEKILSPTFVVQKRFTINHKLFANFYHIDCYRIGKPTELAELGFNEIIKGPDNLVVIEWAERIRDILPADTVWLEFEHVGDNERKIKF